MSQPNLKKITHFIFELNQLKRQKNAGFRLSGVKDPYSTAGHIWRAAEIGFLLAEMENANSEHVVTILIVHDNGETRIGDKHKVSARYLDTTEAEKNAFQEQITGIGNSIEEKINDYYEEFENRNTKEGIIAKDADWLEQAFQAKEYLDLGYPMVDKWIDNVEKAVETESAKKIIREMRKTNFTDWWQGLKKMTYKKLYH